MITALLFSAVLALIYLAAHGPACYRYAVARRDVKRQAVRRNIDQASWPIYHDPYV